jgi:hypothetical protein
MKIKVTILTSLIIATGLSLMSCKKKEVKVESPPTQNEEELITTMKLTFIDTTGVQTNKEFVFRDTDGPGGNAPSAFDTIFLSSNYVYKMQITLLNESVSPADNISDEVLAEAVDHLFCLTPTSTVNLSILRTDSDGTFELGLSSKWTTQTSSTGNVLIVLKHQPGIKNGQCDPGETDIELNFPIVIQ